MDWICELTFEFNLSCKFLIFSINSNLTGVAFSAAAVGVDALKSDTKSIIVVSVSWPIAEIIGIFDSKTLVARVSSLNAIKSSVLPPPLATIRISGLLDLSLLMNLVK